MPHDAHNAALLANVHPPTWRNPVPAPRYNLVVIGAGTAGLVTAAGAAGLGAKVALVERHLLGGDCLNVGCVPSKCVIRSARLAGAARDAATFGVRLPDDAAVDFPAVMQRMRRMRAGISEHDSAHRFQHELGVDVFLGSGRFVGPDCVDVEGVRLRFARAVLATGARAALPAIDGLAAAAPFTNETIFSLTERPPRLAVLGAGPIGCELAQAFCRLGSRVTLIEAGPQFLPREDPSAARLLTAALARDRVELRLSTTLRRISLAGADKVLHLEANGQPHDLAVDAILVAVGRVPNVEGLDLEAARVAYGPHGVAVNDFLQTTNPLVYAAGDICLPYKFTHTADATARLVIQNALFLGRKRVSALTIPWCTYTDPEIAHVGVSEHEAQRQGLAVHTIEIPFSDVDRARVDGEEDGFVRIHLAKGSDRILGATIVAAHAGEMISEITLAMVAGVGLSAIAGVIHPYPTQAEAIRKAADAYNRTRLTPRIQRLFAQWLRWRR